MNQLIRSLKLCVDLNIPFQHSYRKLYLVTSQEFRMNTLKNALRIIIYSIIIIAADYGLKCVYRPRLLPSIHMSIK